MGQELLCRVTFGDSVSEGKALLETTELPFRGDFRLRIPFAAIQDMTASEGRLSVTWPEGKASFEIGANAERWAEKIRNPRGLLDKLGVKPGLRVSILGVRDEGFVDQLRSRAPVLSLGAAAPESDLLFFEADQAPDLEPLSALRATIKADGAIWVVSPKGKGAAIRDIDVIAAARAAGLVDTKVVSFSDTHTALKLVIRVALRSKRRPAAAG